MARNSSDDVALTGSDHDDDDGVVELDGDTSSSGDGDLNDDAGQFDPETNVASLMSITGCSASEATFLLEAAGGDLVMASQLYEDEHRLRQRASRPPPRAVARRDRREALVHRPLPLPFNLLGMPFTLAARLVHLTFSLVNAASRRVLPGPVHRLFCRFFSLLAPRARAEDPVTAAAEFITGFSSKYGERSPKWELTGWEAAAQKSQQNGVFLFIYLHSERHRDSDAFCRETLCSPPFVDYLNATFVSWGGDIRSPEAYRLAMRLNVVRYPYCGLLAFGGAGTRLIVHTEGKVRPEALAELLQRSLTEHGGILWEERLLREQRENDRLLREEQDADYERSLEADRLKALERQEREAEAARREAQERQKREEAEAQQAAAELEREQESERLQARRREKKMLLGDEASESDGETGVIRVRFPSGETEQRRFRMADTYSRVVDWVESLDCNEHVSFSLATTYPRRVLKTVDHGSSTLAELQFEKQTALVIVEEDM
jgi:FAS-associated factor 2